MKAEIDLPGFSWFLLLLAGFGSCNACNHTSDLDARLRAIEERLPKTVEVSTTTK